jgi:hypothetical protein
MYEREDTISSLISENFGTIYKNGLLLPKNATIRGLSGSLRGGGVSSSPKRAISTEKGGLFGSLSRKRLLASLLRKPLRDLK